jgi:hypothetical protein
MIECAREELQAWRHNEPSSCAILKHNNRPYVVLQIHNRVVAFDENGECWAT